MDGFGDHVVDAVQWIGGDDVGRKNVDDVAEGAKQDAALEKKIVQLGAQAGKIAGVVDVQFERAQAADLARIADLVEIAELREAFGMNFGNAANAVEHRLIFKDLKIRIRRGAGQRVPGVGMPVIKRVQAILAAKSGLDAVSAQRNAHRQETAGDAFGDAHDVGRNIGEVTGKHFSGAAEAREDFVGGKKDVVPRAK